MVCFAFFECCCANNAVTLQTIFCTLPRLSEVAEDEWISLCKFERFTDIPLPPAFQWYRSRAELLDLKLSDWSQQDTGKIQLMCIKRNIGLC